MKNLSSILLAFVLSFCFLNLTAADHTIGISGLNYTPADLTVQVGDNITIMATGGHPTAQVSEATWNADGTTPDGSGWGSNTSTFTFTVSSIEVIYYVCQNHVQQGMKGKITVTAATGIDNESINKIGFQIGPNPVIDQTISYSMENSKFQEAMIDIYNEAGQLAHQEKITSTVGSIKLTTESGLYIYVIRNKNAEILASGQLVVVD